MLDHRYYLVNLLDLHIPKNVDGQNDWQLQLSIGLKNSKSNLIRHYHHQKQYSFHQTLHLFQYEAQQFLNLNLSISKNQAMTNSAKKKLTNPLSLQDYSQAYSRILLPPLMQKPHSKHKIQAQFITYEEQLDDSSTVALIRLQLFFMTNFRGKLQLLPLSGHLTHNIAVISEMKPYVLIKIQNKEWRTRVGEGGIRPMWLPQQHQVKGRYLKQAFCENQGVQFPLQCAGSEIEITVYSQSLIGKDLEVGSTKVKLQNGGFFLNPVTTKDPSYQKKIIQIYYHDQNSKRVAGTFCFLFRFQFDYHSILHPQPLRYICP